MRLKTVGHKLTPEQALKMTIEKFPFRDYMLADGEPKDVYLSIAKTVRRYLNPGDAILDFGCGPCDKTAVLKLLGFNCSGYDDLQDDWHKIPQNKEKLLNFTKECEIDFRLAVNKSLPFEKESFDMVMFLDVLEHLHDSPRQLLNDVLELCKPEGFLLVTVPNAVNIRKRIDVSLGKTNFPKFEEYYWYPGRWRGHVREYVKDDLRKLSDYLELELLELKSVDYMLQKLPKVLKPVYLLITGIFEGFKDSWLLVARKKPGWQPRRTLPKE